MSFEEFKEWIGRHRYLSIVLIAFSCLAAVAQLIHYSQVLLDFLTSEKGFEIVKLEVSIRNSVYYEWDKLPEQSKPKARKTQYSDEYYRQFTYDQSYVDSFGQRPGPGVLTALFVMQYAVSKLEFPQNVRDRFNYFLNLPRDDRGQFREFIYELIPIQRYQYESGTNHLVPFIQGDDPIHKHFLQSLKCLHDNPVQHQFFDDRKRPVRQSSVEFLVKTQFALFNGAFLPVFEVFLENNSKKAVTIDEVSAEVIRRSEYLGGAEAIPASKIITIPVVKVPGMNKRALDGDEQVHLKANGVARLLLRLEPRDKLSSYLMRIHVYAGEIHRETEIFAVDM